MNDREPAGLYVHVPFCLTKCPYCDFYSDTDLESASSFTEAASLEIQYYLNRFNSFDTIYFGGGTPSVPPVDLLFKLIGEIFDSFNVLANAEITIEANPDDLSIEKLKQYKKAGFNRLSLGVQSFNDKELAWLKRRHSAKGAETAYYLARDAGFENMGLDLIFGLPGQSRSDWLVSLDKAVGLNPEHLSCYQLTLEKNTAFGHALEQGLIEPLDEEKMRDFFLAASVKLEDNGYTHYEVSNYARGNNFYSRHNRKYWSHADYLGLGPSAHSLLYDKRWWNFRDTGKYTEALRDHGIAVAESETLSQDQLAMEKIFLGLRTKDGVMRSSLGGVTDLDSRIDALEKKGLVELAGQKIIPTRLGLLMADTLALELTP